MHLKLSFHLQGGGGGWGGGVGRENEMAEEKNGCPVVVSPSNVRREPAM